MKVAQNRLEQLQPIASARDRLQSDSATIADACIVGLRPPPPPVVPTFFLLFSFTFLFEVSREIQTPQVSADSKYVQTVCLPQSTNSSTQYETVGTTNVPTQTWTLTGNQSTQTVGNGSQETKLLLHPWCLEPSGLEFPDQKFIDSLIRTKKDPERLPTLRKTGQRNVCDKSITMKVSYGQQTYERHLLASSYIGHDIDHVTSCVTWNEKGVRPYFGESYLLTKCRGQHYILPDSARYSDFKQLDRAGSLCVTLIIYDHERGRYAPAEPQDGEGVRSQNAQ